MGATISQTAQLLINFFSRGLYGRGLKSNEDGDKGYGQGGGDAKTVSDKILSQLEGLPYHLARQILMNCVRTIEVSSIVKVAS